jgi:signal transduction histidine kinase
MHSNGSEHDPEFDGFDMLSVAADELESGLQSLIGRVEMLERIVASPRAAVLTKQIAGDAERLQRVIRDYLAFGQLYRRPLCVDARPVALLPLLVGIAERARDSFGAFPDLRCASGACGLIDRERMEQALWHIVRNAFEHGGPPVVVGVEVTGEWLECGVGDCGAGFDTLVSPADASRQATALGSRGIGLSLASAIIEAHGGTLWIGRARCGGAHIGFRLPASRSPACRHAAE